MSKYIKGYVHEDLVIQGFNNGFSLGFTGNVQLKWAENSKNVKDNEQLILNKINKEISLGKIEGPFDAPPFKHFQCSPLFLLPKKLGGFRLIHNLSAPKSHSVNDGIPVDNSSVTYQNLSHALKLVKKFGKGCLLAKTDIESAFRIIPITKSDYHLLGFTWGGKFYYDKFLAMGASSSCQIFEKFSSSLHWAMEQAGFTDTVHVLDDFLFVGPPKSKQCQEALKWFKHMCSECGIALKSEKTTTPQTEIEFLGITINTLEMEVTLPADKVEKTITALESLLVKEKVTLKVLQSVLGLLNFACYVVSPGRAFMRRLTNLTMGLSKKGHHKRLTLEAKADINAWLTFLKEFNGKSIILEDRWFTAVSLSFYTDASNAGYSCIFGRKWLFGLWPKSWEKHHITIKELFPIVLGFEIWGNDLKNKCITMYSDNNAVVNMINKKTSKHKDCMTLVRRLVIINMSCNILTCAKHIPGVNNVLADSLSRLQVKKFLNEFPTAERMPTAIPPHLLPK